MSILPLHCPVWDNLTSVFLVATVYVFVDYFIFWMWGDLDVFWSPARPCFGSPPPVSFQQMSLTELSLCENNHKTGLKYNNTQHKTEI